MKSFLLLCMMCMIGNIFSVSQAAKKYLDAQLAGVLYGHVKEIRENDKNYSLFNEEGAIVVFEGSPVFDILRDDKDRIISFKTSLFSYTVSWGREKNYYKSDYQINHITIYQNDLSVKFTARYYYDNEGMYVYYLGDILERRFTDRTFDSHGNLVHANEQRKMKDKADSYNEYRVKIAYYPEGGNFSSTPLEKKEQRLLDMLMCPVGFKPDMSNKKSNFRNQIVSYLENNGMRLRNQSQILNSTDNNYYGQYFDIYIYDGREQFKEEFKNQISYEYVFFGSIFEINKLKEELIATLRTIGFDLSEEKSDNDGHTNIDFSRGTVHLRFTDNKSKLAYFLYDVGIYINKNCDKAYPDKAKLVLTGRCCATKIK